MRSVYVPFLFLILFISCSGSPEPVQFTTHIAEVYIGTLPCADCSGIKTELNIRENGSYLLRQQYTGKSDSLFTMSGSYTHRPADSLLTLHTENGSQFWKKHARKLEMLDLSGNKIESDMAELYTLHQSSSLTSLPGSNWILTEMNGIKLENSFRKKPDINFDLENRMAGFAGCNRYFGSYEITAEDRLIISPAGSTRMACEPDANKFESDLLTLIADTFSTEISVDSLRLLSIEEGQELLFVRSFFETVD